MSWKEFYEKHAEYKNDLTEMFVESGERLPITARNELNELIELCQIMLEIDDQRSTFELKRRFIKHRLHGGL